MTEPTLTEEDIIYTEYLGEQVLIIRGDNTIPYDIRKAKLLQGQKLIQLMEEHLKWAKNNKKIFDTDKYDKEINFIESLLDQSKGDKE